MRLEAPLPIGVYKSSNQACFQQAPPPGISPVGRRAPAAMARRALLLLHAAALAVLYLALCNAEPHSGSSPLPNPADHSPWRKQVSSLISFRGNQPVEPQFCVIVRTYWGHSGSHHHGLRRLIRSLRRQTVQRWVGSKWAKEVHCV